MREEGAAGVGEGSVFASCVSGVGNVPITAVYRAHAGCGALQFLVLCSSSEKVSLGSRKESRVGQTGRISKQLILILAAVKKNEIFFFFFFIWKYDGERCNRGLQ